MQLDPLLLHALDLALAPRHRLVSRTTAPSRAAVAVLLRSTPDGPEVLFIHRSEHPSDPWSGHMAFPGGRLDPTDPNEQAAAERETSEEIGLLLSEDARLLGRLDEIQARTREGRLPLAIAPFVYELDTKRLPRLSDEVQSILWVPLPELYAARNRAALSYPIAGKTYSLPSIRFQERVIWGLTLRIVGDLLYRLADGPFQSWLRAALGLPQDQPLLPDPASLFQEISGHP
jgi:8-oxo-dGTP pyrophosphatase MutT (NUDIX family)